MNFIKLAFIVTLAATSLPLAAKVTNYPHSNPNAPYSLATQVDNTVYLSGQIPLDKAGKMAETMTEQSHQVMTNIKDALASIGLEMSDVFKCTVMIDDISQWPDFNAVYVKYFPKNHLPARSAFGVDGLPMGAMVEVECMAHNRRM